MARVRAGHHAAAVEAFARACSLDPESAELLQSLGLAQAEAGMHRDAVTNLENAIRLGRGSAPTRVRLPKSQLALGDLSGALDTLARFRESRSANDAALLADPAFDPVRDDPRFPAAGRGGPASRPASAPVR
jgi:Flp pilus assembly protein TadD